MARVVVDVMLKPEILDPQGKAVHQALPRLGYDGIAAVRQGKRFELEVDGEVTEERLAQIRGAAETLLSNPVIEDYTVRVEDPSDAIHPTRSLLAGARHDPAGTPVKVGVVTFPGRWTTATRRVRSRLAGGEAVRLWHARRRPARRRRGRAARRLLLRRLPALRRDRPLRAGDGAARRRGPRRPAGARHLQRLPGALRVAPAARRADPQRPPQVRLPRPGPAHRVDLDRLDLRVRHGARRSSSR